MKTGFTLIELVFVIAIIGLLTVFAYPSYLNYMTRVHRNEAQTALLDLANRMERYFADHATYQTATIGTQSINDILSNPSTLENHYALSIIHATANTYSLQATPQGTQGKADTQCQSLTYNHLGQKNITKGPSGAPTGNSQACW